MRVLAICTLIGFFGLGMETFVTAIDVAWGKMMRGQPYTDLNGYSSLWYFPLYFSSPLLFEICRQLGLLNHSLLVRGTAYTLIIFAAEYIGTGITQKLVGRAPNEKIYRRSRWNINGRIKLSLAPAWFIAGLSLEYIFLQLVNL